MSFIDSSSYSTAPGGIVGVFARLTVRFFQFVLGLTVVGLYATDLNAARKAHVYADGKWVYATVVGTLAAVAALVFMLPRINWLRFWPVDVVLFVLWVAVFGVFGKMYLHEDPENVGHGDGPGIQRMKNAVWVDLVNMLLWFFTGVYGAAVFLVGGRRTTLHTGRAAL